MTKSRVTLPAAMLFLVAANMMLVLANSKAQSKQEKRPFGKTQDGQPADLYILTNNAGFEVAITNYGGTVVSLKAPDRNGKMADLILGYDSVTGYENGKAYFGGTIGRYGNRIAHGKFAMNGATYTLAKNDAENHLHGGLIAFNKPVCNPKNRPTIPRQPV